jgi:hypothetical protein
MSANLYAYCQNNPVNQLDDSGYQGDPNAPEGGAPPQKPTGLAHADDELDAGAPPQPSVPPAENDAYADTDENRRQEGGTLIPGGTVENEAAKKVVAVETNKAQNTWARKGTSTGVKAGAWDFMFGGMTWAIGFHLNPLNYYGEGVEANFKEFQATRPKTDTKLSQNVATATTATMDTLTSFAIEATLVEIEMQQFMRLGGSTGGKLFQLTEPELLPARAQAIHKDLGRAMTATATTEGEIIAAKNMTVAVTQGKMPSGEIRTVVTVTNPDAHELLAAGGVRLMPGELLGPRPIIGPGGKVLWHAEVGGALYLHWNGATGGFTGCSRAACYNCGLSFTQSGNWTHMNLNPKWAY